MDKLRFTNCNEYTLDFPDEPAYFVNGNDEELDEIAGVAVKVPESWKKGIARTLSYQCEENVVTSQLEDYIHKELKELDKVKNTWANQKVGYVFDAQTLKYRFEDLEVLDGSHIAVTLIADVGYTADKLDNSAETVLNTAEIEVSFS
jgi:hypothetical protein